MHFGFALDLSDIDLLNVDLLDQRYTHLYLFFSKTSWRYVFKTSSRHVFKASSRHAFKTSSRLLQRNNFSSSKTSSKPLEGGIFQIRLEDVLKTSHKTSWRRLQNVFARRLQDVLDDEKLLRWRSVEDIFKTCLEDQEMFAGKCVSKFRNKFVILISLFV